VFTGIIQHVGRVVALSPNDFGAALTVDAQAWNHVAELGESIAVNGCCLTVANCSDRQAAHLRFNLIRQTLAATALGDLRPGDEVNLEHAVTPQTLLSGHLVQGHIDAIGTVIDVVRDPSQHRLRIQAARDAFRCIIPQGSIAVNGVSLTVAATGELWFEVALIPTTLKLTNLQRLRNGARVNLETDYIAKIVVNWLQAGRV
jgi:riboflavin synthase